MIILGFSGDHKMNVWKLYNKGKITQGITRKGTTIYFSELETKSNAIYLKDGRGDIIAILNNPYERVEMGE